MINKYIILPEINLPLRNSLLINTSEGGKVLTGMRHPNHVRIQKVPKLALKLSPNGKRPPNNDLGHENSRASPVREETHSLSRIG